MVVQAFLFSSMRSNILFLSDFLFLSDSIIYASGLCTDKQTFRSIM